MQPANQNQHRVSQVYLKQFGYEIDEKWWVSVYRLGYTSTENLPVDTFTAEFNIFDAPYGNIEFRRNFEIQCGKVESYYPTIISNLINQKKLTAKNVEVLCHFIASLLSRSISFTSFIEMILSDIDACKRFISEISMFNEHKEILKETLKIVPVHLQLNTILGTITAHLVEVLRCFNFLVIKKPTDISWMTTDNPVLIDKKGNFEWLLSPDTEIYLPLSGNFLLFGFHENAVDKTNKLRLLRENKVNKIDIEQFETLQRRISQNLSKYLVMPIHLEDSNIEIPL
ncbi:MAG: DUF4238 domain-containing protein [Bacteroidota bacterium]